MRWLSIIAVSLVACDGLIGDPLASKIGEPELGPACESEPLPGASPGVTRLGHAQYGNIIEDLFGLSVPEALEFSADPIVGGFNNNANELVVDARLFSDYQLTAESVAARIVNTSPAYAKAVPCTPEGDGSACATQVITTNGRRLFRRPLSQAERESYQLLFAAGATSYTEGTAFVRGVRLVLEGMLQSPHFLYRAELGDDSETIDGVEVLPLDPYAIASRLATTLWASTPDDVLLDAAANGGLDTPEGIAAQAERMTASPKLARVLDDFFAQWLRTREFGTEPKVPPLPDTIGDSMRAEVRAYVRDLAERNGTYTELISSPHTFVDADLADIYGLEGSFSSELTRVELDPAQRAGIFTQTGTLSAHAGVSATSPIKRGVFMLEEMACVHVEPPSFAVDPTLPPRDENIVTTRDQIEHHTSNETCQTCHKVINAAGFAFENYDASGAYRTIDNGAPVDASGRLTIKSQELTFTNAVELADLLVDSGIGARCYVDKWYAYSFGREPTHDDLCAAAQVSDAVSMDGHRIVDVMTGLTQTRAFRYRRFEE